MILKAKKLNKGAKRDRSKQTQENAKDSDNAGYKGVKIMVKSDQEKAMVALQAEIQRIRVTRTMPIKVKTMLIITLGDTALTSL